MPSNLVLKFVRQLVESALSVMEQQVNIVQNECQALMQKQVQEVVGTIWIGQGADAFVSVVEDMIRDASNIASDITIDRGYLVNAIEEIDTADKLVRDKARNLAGDFQAII